MKYRKKPVVVEAWQWRPVDDAFDGMPIPPVPSKLLRPHRPWWKPWVRRWQVRTLEGWLFIRPYDYIICGVAGEFYPCKPDIFEQTYKPVEESTDV